MKITIIAKGAGEKALYLHDFFKEGNRITIDSLITDSADSPVALALGKEEIDIIMISPEDNGVLLASQLKERGVELIVIDGEGSMLPEALREEYKDRTVVLTSPASAPLEVIEAGKKLIAPPPAQLPQPQQPSVGPAPESSEPAPSPGEPPAYKPTALEQEWADSLNVDLHSHPEIPKSQEPPQSPEAPESQESQVQPAPPQNPFPGNHQVPPYGQAPAPYGQPQPPYPVNQQQPGEPMPDTYLIWSVLITIICCLIPGIVAIIYSSQVSSKYYQGDLEGAKRASRNAQIWCIVAVICGVVWASLYVPLTLFLS